MTQTLVLHIGDPKTGSTSIQEVLHHWQFECLTRTVDYPRNLSQFRLAKSLHDKPGSRLVDAEFKSIRKWAKGSKAEVLVVSAEQFSVVDPVVVLDAFQQHLPDLAPSMKVVAYVRPHVSRFVSAYAQRTKIGQLFSDMDAFYDRMNDGRALGFGPRFQGWREAFGDRFILRPMVRSELFQGDVVADFLNVIFTGAPFTLLAPTQSNRSLTMESLAGLRLMQQVLENVGMRADTKHFVGGHMNRLLNASPVEKGNKVRIGKAIYARMHEKYRADAEFVDANFFGHPVLVPELDRAAADTVDGTPDANASLYFRPGVRQAIRRRAKELAALFLAEPGVWTASVQRDIGQRSVMAKLKVLPEEHLAHIAAVEKLLAETARLITPK